MSGFWDKKISQMQPQQPAAPSWLAPQPRQQVPHQAPPPQQYQPQQTVAESEHCPRCDSTNYGEFQMDTSFGGTVPPQLGSVRKQCFDCRYPMYNATGQLISGRNGVKEVMAKGGKIKTLNVRDNDYSNWTQNNFQPGRHDELSAASEGLIVIA